MPSLTQSAQLTPSPEGLQLHGLTPDEYERIRELLGRAPNETELGVFGVMW
ncbi:MAG: hypothetical protein ACRD2D_01575, partial [Terriglobales bacterium]